MKQKVFIFILGMIVSALLGAAANYLGYLKWSTKVAAQKTVCIISAPEMAIKEAEIIQLEALGETAQPASDGKTPLREFSKCLEKVDPKMSDLEFAKKMYKESQSNPVK
ncbi:hypothetical protein [Phytobacter sp. V91]|uniref:hypothetical protein n=1 Tax=Phytobacter sp. V91 TaxID=3369425 RepID=UPI003F60FBDD